MDIGTKPDTYFRDDNLIFTNVDFYSNVTQRSSLIGGSHPSDLSLPELNFTGKNLQLINCHIHDIANLGWWTGSDGKMVGCLIEKIGFDAPDRGHGHLYMQNKLPQTKLVNGCIVIKGFGDAVTIYGSNAAFLQGIDLSGLFVLGNRTLIGGSPVDMINIMSSVFNGHLQLGYGEDYNQNLIVQESVMLSTFQVNKYWSNLHVYNNVIAGKVIFIDQNLTNIAWDHNVYYGTKFTVGPLINVSFAKWQEYTGFDKHSVWFPSRTETLSKTYYINQGSHIANLAVWNPLGLLEVFVSRLDLPDGVYELRQIRDQNDRRKFVWCNHGMYIKMEGGVTSVNGIVDPVFHSNLIPANTFPYFGLFEIWRIDI